MTISWSVPGNMRPPISEYSPSLFSRTIRSRSRRDCGERRRHALEQPHRTQVHILLEIAADRHQQRPQRLHVGHRRPADRAEKDRVMAGDAVEPVLRHHPAEAGMIIAAPVETGPTRDRSPKTRPAASTTRMPSGTTSLPIPSPSITAIFAEGHGTSISLGQEGGLETHPANNIVSIHSQPQPGIARQSCFARKVAVALIERQAEPAACDQAPMQKSGAEVLLMLSFVLRTARN